MKKMMQQIRDAYKSSCENRNEFTKIAATESVEIIKHMRKEKYYTKSPNTFHLKLFRLNISEKP